MAFGARRRGAASLLLAAFSLWSIRVTESLVVHEHAGGDRPHVHHHRDQHPPPHHHQPPRPTRQGDSIAPDDRANALHWHASAPVRVARASSFFALAPLASVALVLTEQARPGWRHAPDDTRPRSPPTFCRS